MDDELDDAEREQWDLTEWSDDGDIPDEVDASAINSWLFNESTVDQVLETLMREGRYVADPEVLEGLEAEGRALLRYCAPDGSLTDEANPNGSMNRIAGIVNGRGNVCGLMPHPERAVDPLLGSTDGQKVFASVFGSLVQVRG